MNLRRGNIGLIVLSFLLILAVVIGGFLWWQKRCGAWPFWDPNVRCELGVRIVSQRTSSLTWEECIKVPGAMMQTSYPGVCSTPDGRQVTQTLSEEEKKKLVPPTEQINEEEKDWNLYESATGKFSIKYPIGWEVLDGVNQVTLSRKAETVSIKWDKALLEPTNPSMFNKDIDSQAGIVHLAEFSDKNSSMIEWKSNRLVLKGGDYFSESEMKYLFSMRFEGKNSGEISKIISTFRFL